MKVSKVVGLVLFDDRKPTISEALRGLAALAPVIWARHVTNRFPKYRVVATDQCLTPGCSCEPPPHLYASSVCAGLTYESAISLMLRIRDSGYTGGLEFREESGGMSFAFVNGKRYPSAVMVGGLRG